MYIKKNAQRALRPGVRLAPSPAAPFTRSAPHRMQLLSVMHVRPCALQACTSHGLSRSVPCCTTISPNSCSCTCSVTGCAASAVAGRYFRRHGDAAMCLHRSIVVCHSRANGAVVTVMSEVPPSYKAIFQPLDGKCSLVIQLMHSEFTKNHDLLGIKFP